MGDIAFFYLGGPGGNKIFMNKRIPLANRLRRRRFFRAPRKNLLSEKREGIIRNGRSFMPGMALSGLMAA